MSYEWDESKRLSNLKKHGVDFADIEEFDWGRAVTWIDDREDYGEERMLALGLLRGVIYSVAYAERGEATRIISFRKATRREIEKFVGKNRP